MAATFSVVRSRTVPAPAERVYPLLSNFHQWPRWSPWEDVDPDLHRDYSGPEAGDGAVYAWSGNRKAGAGRMEIVRTEENRLVDIALDFDKPFKASNKTTFTLEPQGDSTLVRWEMVGPKPLVARVFGFVLNMDKLVGRDFEKGLERLARTAPE